MAFRMAMEAPSEIAAIAVFGSLLPTADNQARTKWLDVTPLPTSDTT